MVPVNHPEVPEVTLAARGFRFSTARLTYTATDDDGEPFGGETHFPVIDILAISLPDPDRHGHSFVGPSELNGTPDVMIKLVLEFDDLREFCECLAQTIVQCEGLG